MCDISLAGPLVTRFKRCLQYCQILTLRSKIFTESVGWAWFFALNSTLKSWRIHLLFGTRNAINTNNKRNSQNRWVKEGSNLIEQKVPWPTYLDQTVSLLFLRQLDWARRAGTFPIINWPLPTCLTGLRSSGPEFDPLVSSDIDLLAIEELWFS